MTEEDGITRRKTLAGGAALGAVALAGCAAEESSEGDTTTPDSGVPMPPSRPSGEPDNQYWQYVIASLNYQNQALYELRQAQEE